MIMEYASGPRGRQGFPEHWGTPLGTPGSELRRNWLEFNVRADEGARRDPEVVLRKLWEKRHI